MMKTGNRITGITMGDPCGIGPEIILKSFLNPIVSSRDVVVIGDYDIMKSAKEMLNIESYTLKKVSGIDDCTFGKDVLNILDMGLIDMKLFQPGIIQPASGNAAFRYLEKAVSLVLNNQMNAIATAPLNKEALHFAGHNYPGHTEILAGLTGTKDYTMLLYDDKLSVIHVSTHISLLDAIKTLKGERIEKVIEMADSAMKKLIDGTPRIAVAGLNPHAGENGLFGMEEKNIIAPAVRNMKNRGFNVEGPLPPDTVFLQAVKGKYDIVVAMYHDQGHIPLKLLGFDSGVNITVGLPFIRTSVDHGTAFEIAWKGIAREDSMTQAIRLAWELSK